MAEDELHAELLTLNGFVPQEVMIQKARSLFAHFVSDTPRIQTLHGFCSKILQKMHVINLSDNIKNDSTKIIDDKEKSDLLHESFNEVIFESSLIEKHLRILLTKYDISYLFELICEFWTGISSSSSQRFFDMFQMPEDAAVKLLHEKVNIFFNTEEILSKEEIIESFIGNSDMNLLDETVAALEQSDNVTSKTAAESIKKFTSNPDQKSFFLYLNTLLTNDFKPRARLPLSASAAKDLDHIKSFLLDEQKRLCDAIELINSSAAAELNKAFSILAWSVLKNFNNKKKQQSLFEYSDLIRHTTDLIHHSDDKMALLYSIDMMIDHIMIDEAQDLSEMQWMMIQTITDEFFAGVGMSSGHRTIFIVGDFKQAIFGFQGAAPKIFQEVKRFYREKVVGIGKKWHEIQLDTCYRCAPEILSLVDAVCNSDEVREAFNLHEESIIHRSISDLGHGVVRFHPLSFELSDDKPERLSWHLPTEQTKLPVEKDSTWFVAQNIVATIDEWLKTEKIIGPDRKKIAPQDILILLRKRSKLQDHLVRALDDFSIPVSNLAAKEFGNSIVIYDFLALLQFVLQPLDDMNLIALLKSSPFSLNDIRIMELAIGRDGSIWDRVQNIQLLQEILNKATQLDLQTFFQWYLDDVYIDSNSEVMRFMDHVLHYCSETNRTSFQGFMVWLHETLSKKQQKVYDNKSIRITTVHSAKGLEAPVVILADAASSESSSVTKFAYEDDMFILNTKNTSKAAKEMISRWNDKSVKENMRLLYVAMTRPKYELHVFGNNKDKTSWYTMIRDAVSQ
jgi:ATP-dependent helicase/nuclease subunit A